MRACRPAVRRGASARALSDSSFAALRRRDAVSFFIDAARNRAVSLTPSGLSSAEVTDRVRRGLANRTTRSEAREYAVIAARNVFTGFNAMVAPAALALFAFGEGRGAIAVSGMAILN